MKLHAWLSCQWLSLYDALAAIEDSGLDSLQEVAKCLSGYLDACDMEVDVNLAAYERVLDAVNAALAQGVEVDLLTQLRDDLTYFPDEIISQVRGAT